MSVPTPTERTGAGGSVQPVRVRDAAAPVVAFVWPFHASSNRYIELHKRLLVELGYRPRPLALSELLRGGWRHLLRRDTLLSLHWIEALPFRTHGRPLSITGLPSFLFYLLLVWLVPARSVYFVHNHAVHDLREPWRRRSMRCIELMAAAADLRVVHDPGACTRYDAHYLPHPLYWDAVPIAVTAPRCAASESPLHAVLGAIRPYKQVDLLLEHWPPGRRLLLAGRCTAEHEAWLRTIIARRGLDAWVELRTGFLDDAAFSAELDRTEVLLLPHDPETALVSGAFFEAFGRVPRIVARATPFMRRMAAAHPGIGVYERPQDLPQALAAGATAGVPPDLRAVAGHEFGWATCRRRYGALLAPAVRTEAA